jgi:hypothetical protein
MASIVVKARLAAICGQRSSWKRRHARRTSTMSDKILRAFGTALPRHETGLT